MSHRPLARAPRPTAPPAIERDPDVVAPFLEDAAHVPGGHAAGVTFPCDVDQVAALVAGAERVLPVGALSSLTGGATPRGEIVLSTRALDRIDIDVEGRTVTAGAGVPLRKLQEALAREGLYFPPVPTYDGAFVGGMVATNAAGAATFRYGAVRPWVEALTIVLADGSILCVPRGRTRAGADGWFAIERDGGGPMRVPAPAYRMPPVQKLSAGYYAAPGMDFIDLLIGSEGTLGVIVEATLRVIERPSICLALVTCTSEAQAIRVTAALRESRELRLAGVEYVDERSLALLPDDAFARAGFTRPEGDRVLLIVHLEIETDAGFIDRFSALLETHDAADGALVAPPQDRRGASRILELREAVPATVNARVGSAKLGDGRIEKTAGDMIVPFDRLHESLALYRAAFERRGLDYAIWGHFSDGNLHPNVVPRSYEDVVAGREALLEIGRRVIDMGGSPLAEHGVGRSAIKQALLRELYGEEGIEQMRAVKRALDPGWKLAPDVIFPRERPQGEGEER